MSAIIGLLVLGLLVVIHEWGHLIVAKLCGVSVPAFSVGMGPTLWRRTWHQTEYRVGALPLGGYVLLDSGSDDPSDLSNEISPGRRIWIYLAGPLANFALAFAIFLALGKPLRYFDSLVMMGEVLRGLFTGQIPVHDLAGPVGIIRLAGASARQGFEQLAQFSAILSINLAVLNLLPLPILDGGQIVRALLELVTGKTIAVRWRMAMAAFTWILLLSLFVYVTAADLVRLFESMHLFAA